MYQKPSLLRLHLYIYSLASLLLLTSSPLQAFCGFYVAKADTSLFNRSSQVALVRDGDRNIITMGSDFKGDAKEFGDGCACTGCISQNRHKSG